MTATVPPGAVTTADLSRRPGPIEFKQPTLPTDEEIIRLIRSETFCSRFRAKRTMRSFAKRGSGTNTTLSRLEMRLTHPVLGIIIPDGAYAKPGSAHDALNRRYLPKGKIFAHGKTSAGRCWLGRRSDMLYTADK